jgi:hypothetical protein
LVESLQPWPLFKMFVRSRMWVTTEKVDQIAADASVTDELGL